MTVVTSPETASVLIADDHSLIRLAVRRELEAAGFDVCGESGDAAAAVADALASEPDVCLLDVHLPGGGVETVLRIRRLLPRTKIVMLTSADDEADLVDVIAAGASGYFGKESEPARLPHVLRAVLRGEVAVPRSFVSTLVERLAVSP